jgi:hypothetical protein
MYLLTSVNVSYNFWVSLIITWNWLLPESNQYPNLDLQNYWCTWILLEKTLLVQFCLCLNLIKQFNKMHYLCKLYIWSEYLGRQFFLCFTNLWFFHEFVLRLENTQSNDPCTNITFLVIALTEVKERNIAGYIEWENIENVNTENVVL